MTPDIAASRVIASENRAREITRTLTDKALSERALRRRAVEAAIWGVPLVGFETLRQAFLHDAGARFGDLVWFPRRTDWRLQAATPGIAPGSLYFNFQVGDDPLVLETPPAADALIFGTIHDAWQTPLAEIGAGQRLLIVREGSTAPAPEGYTPVTVRTLNGYGLVRIAPRRGAAETDVERIADGVRLYPLSQAANPPPQRRIDMTGRLFDAVVRYDDSFFDSLARMAEEEPVQSRDLVVMGQLGSLGIGGGQTFKPTNQTRRLLAEAAAEAHAGFVLNVLNGAPYWPKSHWITHSAIGAQTGYSFTTRDKLWLDARGAAYFLGFAPPKTGRAAVRVCGVFDSTRELLEGGRRYRLRTPPLPPVSSGWEIAVYDLQTAAFFREAARVGVDSYGAALAVEPDGAVEILFGPSPPRDRRSNWIYTRPGHSWFAAFTFYGPQEGLLNKSWMLGEIEPLA